jgi:hypothetical protein
MSQFEEEEPGSASGLDDTQPIPKFHPRVAPLTPGQQVLDFLFRVDAGEVRLDGVPEGAKMGNIRIIDVSYIEHQALVVVDVSWTTDGGKNFNREDHLKQVIPIV